MVNLSPLLADHLKKAAARQPQYQTFLHGQRPAAPVNRSPRDARTCLFLGKPTGHTVEVTSYG
jgi:hypothetical protein